MAKKVKKIRKATKKTTKKKASSTKTENKAVKKKAAKKKAVKKKTVTKKAVTKKKKTTMRKATRKHTKLKQAALDKFRDLLLIKRAEILGNVDAMKEGTLNRERSELSNVPFHMADAGSDTYELDNTLGLMDEEIRILKEIDAALVRIEQKTYGVCMGNDEIIPKARLEAIPWAKYCITCAEMVEKGVLFPEDDLDYGQFEEDDDEYEDIAAAHAVVGTDDEEQDIEPEDEEIDEAMEHLDDTMALMGDDEGDDEEDKL